MKCKNCGAEINNGKCEYCGSVFLEDMLYFVPNIKIDADKLRNIVTRTRIINYTEGVSCLKNLGK
jgi:hypothetical protein